MELQSSLIKFNRFLQENEFKRQRAERRAAEESATLDRKRVELGEKEKALSRLLRELRVLDEEVERNRRYEEFLSDVLQANQEVYQEIQDLLNRHTMLCGVRDDLKSEQQHKLAAVERAKNVLHEMQRDAHTHVLNCNTRIASLKKELEELQHRTQALQSRVHVWAGERGLWGVRAFTLTRARAWPARQAHRRRFGPHQRAGAGVHGGEQPAVALHEQEGGGKGAAAGGGGGGGV